MEQLGSILFSLNQSLSLILPAALTSQQETSSSRLATVPLPPTLCEVNSKPFEFFSGNLDHCREIVTVPTHFQPSSPAVRLQRHSSLGALLHVFPWWLFTYFSEFSMRIHPCLKPPSTTNRSHKTPSGVTTKQTVCVKHTLEFCITTTCTGWDETALQSTFLHSSKDLKISWPPEMNPKFLTSWSISPYRSTIGFKRKEENETTTPKDLSLPGSIQLWVNTQPSHQCRRTTIPRDTPPSRFHLTLSEYSTCSQTSEMEAEPMQVGHTHLFPEGRQRCMVTKSCIYSGNQGHFIAECPFRGNKLAHKREILVGTSSFSTTSHLTLPTMIQINQTRRPVVTVVDSMRRTKLDQ